MAEVTQFESDQFLELLTDALRAGPGSPQWHQALVQLRSGQVGEAEQYQLLIEARERLESGREYRSIRPGPGFTRKVMAAIDEEGAGPQAPVSSSALIAIISAGVILCVIIVVGLILMRSGSEQRSARDLQRQTFSATVLSSDFSQDIPPEWNRFGRVPPSVDVMAQLLHAEAPEKVGQDFIGAGIVLATPVSPDETVELDVTVNVQKPSDNAVVQLFVTDQPNFEQNPEATTPREVVIYLQRNTLTVVTPDNRIVGEAKVETSKPVHLVLKIDKRFLVAEDGMGRELYAGEHGLPQDKPRWPGVRFLTRGRNVADVGVQSIRILKP